MRHRILLRALPGLAVLALLCLAAARPATPTMPAPPPLFYYCPQITQAGDGTLTQLFTGGAGVSQPLPEGISVAACSLRVEGTGWTSGNLLVQAWDPLTLSPDPSAIALRAVMFDPSSMNAYTTNSVPAVRFVPPIVTRSLSGVAEPPRQTVAIEVRSLPSSYFYPLRAFYASPGTDAMPAAGVIAADGTRGPLPGEHPVIAHAICSGDDDLQQLRIAQSVSRTSTLPNLAVAEIAQRFRVPEPVELRWIEVALSNTPPPAAANVNGKTAGPPGPTMPVSFPVIGIVDGGALPEPVATMPATLVEATLTPRSYGDPSVWKSHYDFDHTVVLQPFHDYWLYLRGASDRRFFVATLTGNEGPDFAAGIGPYFERDVATNTWGQTFGYALAFRVVGRPLSSLGSGPPPSQGGLRLRVAPNPATGFADASWSGGVGPVRLEVFDARGRRVARGEGGAAGAWHWSGRSGGGGPLPAGVYFVHARDSAGSHAVQRVVLVR